MDSFEVNKILGAVLGTCTFTLALIIGSEILFHEGAPEKPGYEIVVPETPAAGGAPAAAQVEPIAVRLAKADPAKGEALTKQCQSCHSFEKGGPNKVGPNLYGVVGNHHAHLDSFSYSGPMKEKSGEQWTYEALDAFLENPKAAIPGTAMSYAGLKKPDARADLIAYLNQNSDNPLPPPEAPAAAEGAPAGEAPAGEAPAGQAAPAGEAVPAGQAPAAGAPAGEAPAAGETPAPAGDQGAAAPAPAGEAAPPAGGAPAAPH